MEVTKKNIDELSYAIIGCAIEVHKALGPGLLESVYQKCLIRELLLKNFDVKSQLKVPIKYKGLAIEADLRLDMLVNDLIVLEIKAVDAINPVYGAQVLSYMKLLSKCKGILLNFCCTNIYKEGQRTYVNQLYAYLPDN